MLDLERYTKVDLKPEDIKDFYPWQWNAFRLYNIRWGMPKYVNMMTLWVNKDLFEKNGVKLPTKDWTHNDYGDAMTRLTKTRGAGDVTIWGGGPHVELGPLLVPRGHVGRQRGRPQGQHPVPARPEAGAGRPWTGRAQPVGPADHGQPNRS